MRLSLILVIAAAVFGVWPAAADPIQLHVDYAAFNPLSVVLKNKHWLEDALGDDYAVDWVQDGTTNSTLDRLRVRGLDIGSSASAGTLLQKLAGTAVKIVYIYSKPRWTGLVVAGRNPAGSIADLRNKRVAVSIRTEPGIYMLHLLGDAGMSAGDIVWVPLHDQSGRMALDLGQVDAWAGFDPYTAQAELENADRVLADRADFDSYGVLDVRQSFLDAHQDVVAQVVRAYERTRLWVLGHRAETEQILVTDEKLSPAVASRQLDRTDFTATDDAGALRQSLGSSFDVLKSNGLVPADADRDAAINDLIDPRFAAAPGRPG